MNTMQAAKYYINNAEWMCVTPTSQKKTMDGNKLRKITNLFKNLLYIFI